MMVEDDYNDFDDSFSSPFEGGGVYVGPQGRGGMKWAFFAFLSVILILISLGGAGFLIYSGISESFEGEAAVEDDAIWEGTASTTPVTLTAEGSWDTQYHLYLTSGSTQPSSITITVSGDDIFESGCEDRDNYNCLGGFRADDGTEVVLTVTGGSGQLYLATTAPLPSFNGGAVSSILVLSFLAGLATATFGFMATGGHRRSAQCCGWVFFAIGLLYVSIVVVLFRFMTGS